MQAVALPESSAQVTEVGSCVAVKTIDGLLPLTVALLAGDVIVTTGAVGQSSGLSSYASERPQWPAASTAATRTHFETPQVRPVTLIDSGFGSVTSFSPTGSLVTLS